MAPFDRSHTVSYSYSVVTMTVTYTIAICLYRWLLYKYQVWYPSIPKFDYCFVHSTASTITSTPHLKLAAATELERRRRSTLPHRSQLHACFIRFPLYSNLAYMLLVGEMRETAIIAFPLFQSLLWIPKTSKCSYDQQYSLYIIIGRIDKPIFSSPNYWMVKLQYCQFILPLQTQLGISVYK